MKPRVKTQIAKAEAQPSKSTMTSQISYFRKTTYLTKSTRRAASTKKIKGRHCFKRLIMTSLILSTPKTSHLSIQRVTHASLKILYLSPGSKTTTSELSRSMIGKSRSNTYLLSKISNEINKIFSMLF